MCFLHLHVGGAFDSHVQFLEICHVHHDTDVRNKSGWTVEFLEAFMENWVKEFDFERFVIFFLLFFFQNPDYKNGNHTQPELVNWAMKKGAPGCLRVYMGMMNYPVYVGIVSIN